MLHFYVDTSIWRDYFEDRHDGIRPLGEFAFQFLNQCKKKKAIIYYSQAVLFELREFQIKFEREKDELKEILFEAPYNRQQLNEARQLSIQRNVPTNDALHAIIARDTHSTIISRDSHFKELQDIANCQLPEEVIWNLY